MWLCVKEDICETRSILGQLVQSLQLLSANAILDKPAYEGNLTIFHFGEALTSYKSDQ